MADNRISGRLALITGASGGIGAACARDLAAQGCHLALTYSTNRSAIDELVESFKQTATTTGRENSTATITATVTGAAVVAEDKRISIHKVDLGSVEEIERLFVEIKEKHKTHVDILVSNAGYGKRIVDINDIPLSEFDHTLTINLRASFLLTQCVVPAMKAQKWGRIVFISSIAAYGGGINGCHYAASKGGLTAMMKNLASNLGKYNISVNDVAPAMIGATGMIPNQAAVPGVVEGIPLGRLGEPGEVARVVRMFVETGFVTGQSLLVAGGLR